MTEQKIPTVSCNDECGARVPEDQLEASGWQRLQIQQNRYRCIECWRKLEAVNHGISIDER